MMSKNYIKELNTYITLLENENRLLKNEMNINIQRRAIDKRIDDLSKAKTKLKDHIYEERFLFQEYLLDRMKFDLLTSNFVKFDKHVTDFCDLLDGYDEFIVDSCEATKFWYDGSNSIKKISLILTIIKYCKIPEKISLEMYKDTMKHITALLFNSDFDEFDGKKLRDTLQISKLLSEYPSNRILGIENNLCKGRIDPKRGIKIIKDIETQNKILIDEAEFIKKMDQEKKKYEQREIEDLSTYIYHELSRLLDLSKNKKTIDSFCICAMNDLRILI